MIYIQESNSKKCVGETSLFLKFDYNETIINIIKQTGEAVWDKKALQWEVPCNKLSYLIDEFNYIDDIDLQLQENQDIDKLIPVIQHKYKPFTHQEEGIEWLINNKNSLLLDCPGLGKTTQIIYAAEELKLQRNIEHCLIICGINTLKQNWKKEIEKFSTLSCRVIGEKINKKGKISYASVKDRADELYNPIEQFFIIINVESLRDNLVIDAIRSSKNKFDMIVIDEVHKVSGVTSQQGKNLLKLKDVGEYHYCLTGTLLTTSPLNAYAALKFIGKEHTTYSAFKNFYCNFTQLFGHYQITGYKNIDLLKSEIDSCSLRRSKDLLNLPPKVIVPEYIEMNDDQAKFYEELQNGVVEEADRVTIKNTTLLGLIVRLRQAASCPSTLTSSNINSTKLQRACELVEEICSNGDKVLIFSTFKDPLYKLNDMLKQYKPLLGTGDQTDEEINTNKDKFQNNDENKVFLATTQKMGTGVTLTRASYEIFIDSDWNWSEFEQCCDRAYRIGTTKSVIIYYLICKNTIDERVYNILNRKKNMSDYIIDDKVNDEEELKELLGLDII